MKPLYFRVYEECKICKGTGKFIFESVKERKEIVCVFCTGTGKSETFISAHQLMEHIKNAGKE